MSALPKLKVPGTFSCPETRPRAAQRAIAIFGSTGSIGSNACEVAYRHRETFRVKVLAARRNWRRLAEQARRLGPDVVVLLEDAGARELERSFSGRSRKPKIWTGEAGLKDAARLRGVDVALFSMVGAQGLPYILEAIRSGTHVAIANKEPIVMAGEWLRAEAARAGVEILPVDSEHSAIWQCLHGASAGSLSRIILTSTGGPFRSRPLSSFGRITPREALRHPRWRMGPKITVDSATLMNKGLEIIEASRLFGVGESQVDVLVHPEAIVHSLVEFVDGSHLAQLAVPDMRIPIQYALSYPRRLAGMCQPLDLARLGSLHFERAEARRFPALALARRAARDGRTVPAVLNAANEVAVELFLTCQIRFPDIVRRTERVLSRHSPPRITTLDAIFEADRWAREDARRP